MLEEARSDLHDARNNNLHALSQEDREELGKLRQHLLKEQKDTGKKEKP